MRQGSSEHLRLLRRAARAKWAFFILMFCAGVSCIPIQYLEPHAKPPLYPLFILGLGFAVLIYGLYLQSKD